MKKYLGLFLLTALFCVSAFAQKIPKPTLNTTESTQAQAQIIGEGIKLHDEKKYDEAIKKYEQVLKESPDNMVALYEMAFSYAAKGDKVKSFELAMKGSQYQSRVLPRFYLMIANIWDDEGKSQNAVELYQDTIKLVESDKSYDVNLSILYLNYGISLARQKQYEKSREALKKSVELDYANPSPSYLLAEVFLATKYKIPALLAATRLLSLENFSARTKRASLIFQDVLTGGAKKGDKANSINIFVDTDEPKDEGDFSGTSLILGLVSAGTDISEENKNKSEEEKFVDKVESLIGFLADDAKKNKSKFVVKTYLPFLLEIKQKGYLKTFSYLVLANSGNAAAAKWVLNDNPQKVVEFMSWAKSYNLPK